MLPEEISERFRSESKHIGDYVATIAGSHRIGDRELLSINNALSRLGVRPFPIRKKGIGEELTQEDLKALREASAERWNDLLKVANELDDDSDPFAGFDPDQYDLAMAWAEYFRANDEFPADPSERTHFIHSAYLNRKESGASCLFDEDGEKEIIDRALMMAELDQQYRRRADAIEVVERLAAMRLAIRLRLHDAEINLFRQRFILLLTAFDAAVFDLVRVALEKDFFHLIGKFGGGEKLSLHQFGEWGSLEKLVKSVSEQQLKRLYLKDVLKILQELGVPLLSAGDQDSELYELVLRRNLHVHNRGIVDQRYLDSGHNVFQFTLGDIATVDVSYTNRADRLCSTAIDGITAWVKQLP